MRKSETYHWHNVCDVVHLFVGMHEICRKLRQTGVATMAMTRNAEPLLVWSPNPCRAKENCVG